MATPYIGEIRIFGGNFAPAGWAFCNGQLLSISQNEALFSLLGTTYGGDGINTFGLPDLRGRLPMHAGPQYQLGQMAGSETVQLSTNQLPVHQHPPTASSGGGNANGPQSAIWAATARFSYGTGSPNAPMNVAAVQPAGGGHPHDNLSPFLTLSFIIALEGIYPAQS